MNGRGQVGKGWVGEAISPGTSLAEYSRAVWAALARDALHLRMLAVYFGVLLAWVAVMMPAFAGLPLLGFVLIGCYVMDRRTWPAAGLAPWLPMRLQLTLVASLSCFLAAGAT